MKKTFEQWLDNYYEKNINSNSNNMNPEFENARDRWFSNLDVQEIIDFGDEYMNDTIGQLRQIVQKYTDPKPEYDGIVFDTILSKLI